MHLMDFSRQPPLLRTYKVIRILIPTLLVMTSALFLLLRHWHIGSSSERLFASIGKIEPATQEALNYIQMTKTLDRRKLQFGFGHVLQFYWNSRIFKKTNRRLPAKLSH